MIKQKLQSAWNWLKSKTKQVLIGIGILGVASASAGGAILDERANPYEKIEDRFEIQLPEQARISVSENEPALLLEKWDSECHLKVKLKTNKTAKVKRKLLTNKLEWKHGNNKVHMYPIENGFEYEVIFDEKPISNVITLDIETQGLKYYYQPPLNEEKQTPDVVRCTETDCYDKDDNVICHRPENVVGSYAVYHESKQGDYSKMGLKNYRAGKAFHIYRPKIIDAEGKEVWGILNITDSTLTVEIPQEFLDNAVYPVIVDPTFGWGDPETHGETYVSSSADRIWAGSYASGGSGTVTKISVYCNPGFSANWIAGGLWKDSDESKVGVTDNVDVSTSPEQWYDMDFSTQPDITSQNYWIGMNCDNSFNLWVDATGGSYCVDVETFGSWPNTLSLDASGSYLISIYCTYSSNGAERRIIIVE